MNAWMVRAGDYNELLDQFWKEEIVAIGWQELADTTSLENRGDYKNAYTKAYPAHSTGRTAVNAGQIYRFEKEIQVDDYVLTFDKVKREYFVGKCIGKAKYSKTINKEYPRVRPVKWLGKFSRSQLSAEAQNSFGSVLTVFSVTSYISEIEACLSGKHREAIEDMVKPEEAVPFYIDTKTKADEKIADILSQLDPYDFQYLIGAIFRAMGFKTIEKDPGRDRGVDIIAFKDEFGFEKPRIKVQVKHRASAAGGPEIRNFIGALDEGEVGIFVSTSGFKGDAIKEVGRLSTKMTIYSLEDVMNLLLKYYDHLEPEFRNLVPLAQIWIPIK